jgi:septal ring factor EnvC (AmiA/AmiB activator)
MGLAIALGAAAGGILTTVILFFVLLRGEQSSRTRADDRADKAERDAKELRTALASADERGDVLEKNQGELLKEIAATKSTLQSTEADLASVKASHDELVRTLADHPGALPPLVHAALERLRAQVSAGQAASAAGDPNGGKARSVSGPDALEPPE